MTIKINPVQRVPFIDDDGFKLRDGPFKLLDGVESLNVKFFGVLYLELPRFNPKLELWSASPILLKVVNDLSKNKVAVSIVR